MNKSSDEFKINTEDMTLEQLQEVRGKVRKLLFEITVAIKEKEMAPKSDNCSKKGSTEV